MGKINNYATFKLEAWHVCQDLARGAYETLIVSLGISFFWRHGVYADK